MSLPIWDPTPSEPDGTPPDGAPASQALSMSPCDGQPHLITARYSAALSIQTIRVDIQGNLLWTAQLVGCTNVEKCAQD